MKGSRIITLVLLCTAVAGCGDDATNPAADGFSLDVTVVDAAGQPVAGLVASLYTPIPGAEPDLAKAVTRIPFTVPVDSVRAVLTIGNLDGSRREVYHEGIVRQGSNIWNFSSAALGIELPGTTVYEYELVVTDEGEELFRDARLMTVHTSFDSDQRPTIGTTDTAGKLSCRDRNLFPFLFELGPQPLLDEDATPVGEFTFGDSVVVTLTDTVRAVRQAYPVVLAAGINRVELRWQPVGRAAAGLKTGPATAVAAPTDGPIEVVPPEEFRLLQNYPNPFN